MKTNKLFICLFSANLFSSQLKLNDIINLPKEIRYCADWCTKTGKVVFDTYGAIPPKGIMVVGSTGTGKTSIAKALKSTVECPFEYYNTDFWNSAKDVKDAFESARNKAKSSPFKKAIIYLDNFDSLSSNTLSQNTKDAKKAALLEEIDGYQSDDSIIVIAASNKKDDFSESLVRSGRLDHICEIDLPNKNQRTDLLKKLCTQKGAYGFDPKINFDFISKITDGFTPADIIEITRNSRILASNQKTTFIEENHLVEATKNIIKTKGLYNKDLLIKLIALSNIKNQKTGFDSIIGGAPKEICQMVDQIKGANSLFNKFNLSTPKEFLFTGPPGTGKTSLARAIAEESGCEFVSINASEINGSLVGSGVQKIKDLFSQARKKAISSDTKKCIIFIDEIDSLGMRSGNTLDTTINQLLTEIDGFIKDDSIIVIGATNNPKGVDSALTRAGRLEKTIRIGLPNANQREEILKHYLKNKPVDKSINLKQIALLTNNFSPADISLLILNASNTAISGNRAQITQGDLISGIKSSINTKIAKNENGAQQLLDALEVALGTKEGGFKSVVGGVPEEIENLLNFLQNKFDYKKYGLTSPKGFLFTGPPGTGKTALARALAEESGCEFVATKGSDFINQYVGVGAENIRQAFEEARKKAEGNKYKKTILFIDEIDAIGSRGGNDSGESKRTLTALLQEIDGFNTDDSVIVIAATNDPNSLDAALTRSGRLETIVEIGLPDLKKREAILKHYTKNKPLSKNINFSDIAQRMNGCNAADLKNLVNIAANLAMKENTEIDNKHLISAINKLNSMQSSKFNKYI